MDYFPRTTPISAQTPPSLPTYLFIQTKQHSFTPLCRNPFFSLPRGRGSNDSLRVHLPIESETSGVDGVRCYVGALLLTPIESPRGWCWWLPTRRDASAAVTYGRGKLTATVARPQRDM